MQLKTESPQRKHLQIERRTNTSDRRKNNDRRAINERRQDFRDGSNGQRRTLRVFLRSLTNARLGVDRRKDDRRRSTDRRNPFMNGILTKEELADLLS